MNCGAFSLNWVEVLLLGVKDFNSDLMISLNLSRLRLPSVVEVLSADVASFDLFSITLCLFLPGAAREIVLSSESLLLSA